jgi:hypothetical protein
MSNLSKRYEVMVIAHYTSDDIEAQGRQDAEEKATHEFYDNSHRASIEDTRITDEWLVCDDCDEERVEDDHDCEESDDEELSDDY